MNRRLGAVLFAVALLVAAGGWLTTEAPFDSAQAKPFGLAAGEPQGKQRTQRKTVDVSGCVVKGVEGGCLMLVTKNGTKYNILAEEKPVLGTWIQIRGTRHDGPTICMEGIPVRVLTWKKLADRCPRTSAQ